MMTDKQLKALMEWVVNHVRAGHDRLAFMAQDAIRRDLYDAFGFVEGKNEEPVVPPNEDRREGHRQAIADAAAENRISGLRALFNDRWAGVPMTHRALAESLACLWPELKAIMEPRKCGECHLKPGEHCDVCGAVGG